MDYIEQSRKTGKTIFQLMTEEKGGKTMPCGTGSKGGKKGKGGSKGK